MACERYREEVLGAAAGWLEPEREIRLDAHLHDCSACRREFQGQQRLFAAMEEGLRARVSEELPVGYAARVRARLNEHATPRLQWFTRRVPTWRAVAATAVLAAGLFILHSIQRNSGGPDNQPIPVARNVASPEIAPPQQVSSAETPSKHTGRQSGRFKMEITPVVFTQTVVLLPPGQKAAMARLVEGLRSGELQGELFLAESRELQPVQIAPLEISAVELKPLVENRQRPQ